jgi:hypothetical protein
MTLEELLSPDMRALFASLTTPRKIQDFLDSVAYEPEYFNRAPLRVLVERRGHCLDGALFGAAALRRLGYRPLIVDLIPEPLADDDHVLAIYRRGGAYGAVAKSNFSGLRYREPVYRTLRELVMSYFEDFFNRLGRKTLRAYTVPLDLSVYDKMNWETDDTGCDAIEQRLKDLRRYELLTPEMIRSLTPVDRLTLDAGLLGSNPEGLYIPGIA